MQRKAKISPIGLGVFFCRFNLEEGRERRSTKVTLSHLQALEEGERQEKV